MAKPYNPVSAADYLPRHLLQEIQLKRLQNIVKHEYDNVPFYRQRMDEKGVKPEDIKTLKDIQLLPFTMKKDLRDTYPFGLFAVPMSQIVRLHASSGTTGKPIVVGYTKEDVESWSNCMARSLAAGGVTSTDIIQNSYGYGLFTGGLGAHYGIETLGATVVPTSGGNTERQIMLMRDFGVTGICCTPSYFLHFLDIALRFRQIGNFEQAQTYLVEYLQHLPNDPVALTALASCYEQCSQYGDAMRFYQQALNCDADNSYLQKAVERISLYAHDDEVERELLESTKSRRNFPLRDIYNNKSKGKNVSFDQKHFLGDLKQLIDEEHYREESTDSLLLQPRRSTEKKRNI